MAPTIVIIEHPDRVSPQANPPIQRKLEQDKAGEGVWLGLGKAIASWE